MAVLTWLAKHERFTAAKDGPVKHVDYTMIPVRFYIYAGIVLVAIGGIWYTRAVVARANLYAEMLDKAEANYAALQAAQAHERKIAKESLDDREARLKRLEDAKADTPVRSVRLCRNTPSVSSTATTPGGTSSTNPGGLQEAAGFHPGYGSGLQTGEVDRWGDAGPDIGPLLYALADEANRAAAQCNALIKWSGSR
jgi:hypothetical protein